MLSAMALFQGTISHRVKIPTHNYRGIIYHRVHCSEELYLAPVISRRLNSFSHSFLSRLQNGSEQKPKINTLPEKQ